MFKNFNLQNKYIFFIGILCLFIASFFSTGYHHFDEHFQILEFAGLKLGLTTASNLPWEYHYQMRPSLQPFIVVIIYQLFGFLNIDNPFLITFFLRILSGGLTVLSLMLLYKVYYNKISDMILRKWFLILLFSLWFIVYIGVRFSSETWSGLFFTIGFSSYFLFQRRTFLSYLTIGVLFGLSFLFRYQATFLIFGFFLWLLIIKKEYFTNLITVFLGFILVFSIGVLVDKWFYGEWTLTTWNYFAQNILENKVSSFGVEPWWWYIPESIVIGVPPISLLLIVAFFLIAILKPKNPIVWSVIPFILIHSIIGHKEMRFLYPIFLFLPVIIIQGIEVLQNKYVQNLSSDKYMRGFIKLIFIVNAGALLIVMFKPADNQISLYHKLYKDYNEPTTLYYLKGNPYHRVLDIYFYRRKNLSIEPIKSLDDIPEGKNRLVIQEHRDETNNPKLGKLIYTTYPDWILKYNFNNWQEHSHSWYIYELK